MCPSSAAAMRWTPPMNAPWPPPTIPIRSLRVHAVVMSVLGGTLDVRDDDHGRQAFGPFQLQAEHLLNGRKHLRPRIFRAASVGDAAADECRHLDVVRA